MAVLRIEDALAEIFQIKTSVLLWVTAIKVQRRGRLQVTSTKHPDHW
jgi:hypothetical protein